MSEKESRLSSFIANKAREVASLQDEGATNKNPRSEDKFASSPFSSDSSPDSIEPPKDQYRRYWRQFETTPIIREPITSYAREVIQPGYRVESPDLDEEQLKKLVNWLRSSAIISGLTDENMSELIKKAVVQIEVKGTVFIEKVYAKEDSEKLLGFKFIPAETMEINKRPNQNMVLQPGDEKEFDDVPTTEDGVAAAYTQTRPSRSAYGGGGAGSGSEEINFTKDEVLKITRDEDTGEALGTSRLESVSQRIEGLKKKLRDNDEAISSKAYPLWLFMFGSEEAPWDRNDIDSFMQAHEMDNFHPGMKQGVRGDVDVETISGEVADIAEYLEFDLNWILSAMPKAKYTLGAYEASINQFVTQSQERDTQRQIEERRREFESKLSPVVQQKAEQMFGLSEEEARNLRFRVGAPEEDEMPQQQNVNVIRYVGGDTKTGGQNDQNPQGRQNDQNPQGNQQTGDDGEGDNVASEQARQLWEAELSHDHDTEELADPRFVSTSDEESDLSNVLQDTFMEFRENVLSEVERRYQGSPQSALAGFSDLANSEVETTLRQQETQQKSNAVMEAVVAKTVETLGQRNQEVDMDVTFGFRHRQQAENYGQNVTQSTRDALHEFGRRMRGHLERGVGNGESFDTIIQRIRNDFNDAELSERSDLISRMQIQNSIENTKLNEFSMNDDVVAVRPINICGPETTRLCENLAGCGVHQEAIARLDEDLSEQWQDQVPDALMFKGFAPMPAAPPWHFNCRTELVPITEEELEDYEPKRGESYTVEQLEDKYGIEVEET